MLEYKRAVLGVMHVNCYTVYCSGTKHGIIIDPGANLNTIIQTTTELGIKPDAVVLTHAHFDHIVHAEDIRKMYNIPIVVHEAEKEILKNPDMNMSSSFMHLPISLDADVVVKDGEYISFGDQRLKVIHTPGHTKGSMSLYADGVLFSGDTLFRDSYGRTDFPTGDAHILADSLKKLFELPDDTIVNPGHNDVTTIGREKQFNYAAKSLMENTEW